MKGAEFQALLPLIALGATSVAVMLLIAFRRNHLFTLTLTLLGLSASFACLFPAASAAGPTAGTLLLMDRVVLYYLGLLIAAAAGISLMAPAYLEGRRYLPEEFYLLVLLATLGACLLAAAAHFAALFLGLELLTVSLYALVAYFRNGQKCIEAGVKYLILAAVSSAFLLFGMALLYARLGVLSFEGLAAAFAVSGAAAHPFVLAGLGLLFVGVGFKLALVPFHMWTPDVYEGAPAPAAALVATVSKGGMVALLVRFAGLPGAEQLGGMILFFSLAAAASMVAGNLLALLQTNLKRLLAYSSIAHLGYMLTAFLAGGARGGEAVAYYLAAYFFTILGAFGVIAALSGKEGDLDRIEDLRGLGRRRPYLAGMLAFMLLSLAGIPLTGGFTAKFLVIAAGADADLWGLLITLVLTSAVGLYYYLRVVVFLYMQPEEAAAGFGAGAAESGAAWPGRIALLLFSGAVLWLGIWPEVLLEWIRSAA